MAKSPVDPARAAARVAEEAQVAQGQRTAVITGAVSIVFGVRHLQYALQHSDVCRLKSGASDFVGCSVTQCMVWAFRQHSLGHHRSSTHLSPAASSLPYAMQVLYLVLVQFLDSRGGEMQPPPPEAFGL